MNKTNIINNKRFRIETFLCNLFKTNKKFFEFQRTNQRTFK